LLIAAKLDQTNFGKGKELRAKAPGKICDFATQHVTVAKESVNLARIQQAEGFKHHQHGAIFE
jgi:hypothetical protein